MMLVHDTISPLKRKRGRPRKYERIDLSIQIADPAQFGEGRTLKGEEFRRRKRELEDEYRERERREKARG